MKFAIVNDTTLRCIITEEELDHLGFGLDELISNKERAQDFLQIVLEDAEEETGFRMDETAAIAVEATMLPGKGLALLISDGASRGKMQDKLRRFQDAMSDFTKLAEEENPQKEEFEEIKSVIKDCGNYLLVEIASLDNLLAFTKCMSLQPKASSLYKLEECYYLLFEDELESKQLQHIGLRGIEFCESFTFSSNKVAYVKEHGELIIKKHAMEQLKSL